MDRLVSREHAETVLTHVGVPTDKQHEILDEIKFPVHIDELLHVVEPFGITKDALVSRMGGSP